MVCNIEIARAVHGDIGRVDKLPVPGASASVGGKGTREVCRIELAFTDLMTANFQPVAEPGLGFTATIDLSDHEGGTLYHVTARHRTADDTQKHETMGFTNGWGTVATQLEAYAQTL